MQDSKLVALVEQLAHMNADHFIVARVSSETKTRLHAFAERETSVLRLGATALFHQGIAQLWDKRPNPTCPARAFDQRPIPSRK